MSDREVQHSPEPWTVTSGVNNPGDAWVAVRGHHGEIVIYDSMNLPELPRAMANIERIVACVNACAGIPTEDLLRCTGDNPTLKVVGVEHVTLKPVGAVPFPELPT